MAQIKDKRSISTSNKGRPDFTSEINEGKRMETRRKKQAGPDETVKAYEILASSEDSKTDYVVGEIASGNSQKFIRTTDGETMPVTIAAGNDWELLELWWSVNQDATIKFRANDELGKSFKISSRQFTLNGKFFPFSLSGTVDPNLQNQNKLEFELINDGSNSLAGYVGAIAVIK